MDESNEIILYQTEDGETKLEVTMHGETVWLTQAQMATLFQTERSGITKHLRNIFKSGELPEEGNVNKFHIAGSDKPVKLYNLDVIISVGYRVNTHRGVQFRIWATKTLREYLVKGFVMNDERLAGGGTNYFDELLDRIRHIRTSEHNFYEKVKAVFTTSIDYDPKTDFAKQFYASVQNKFHYAITGHTAAELIVKRIGADKQNMGLTNWKGKIITSDDAKVAKNYLEELEIKRLQLLVEQFLVYSELQALEKRPMYMADWLRKLDEFIVFNERQLLTHKGKVSHKEMETVVREALAKFNQRTKGQKQIAGQPEQPQLMLSVGEADDEFDDDDDES